jgi:hypothetical protein
MRAPTTVVAADRQWFKFAENLQVRPSVDIIEPFGSSARTEGDMLNMNTMLIGIVLES